MKGIIYYLVDPREPEHIRYIGVTSRDMEDRGLEHIKEAKYYKGKNTYKLNWIRKLLSEGVEPKQLLLKEFDFVDEEELFLKEVEIVKEYKEKGHKLTNTTLGGKGTLGHTLSPEVKKLLSDKGKEQWKNMSEEERKSRNEFNSRRMKGNSFRKGKKDPPERIESKKGQIKGKNSPTWKGYWIQMDEKGKKINSWESIEDAAQSIGVSYKAIWYAGNSKTKSGDDRKCGGYYWKQIKE